MKTVRVFICLSTPEDEELCNKIMELDGYSKSEFVRLVIKDQLMDSYDYTKEEFANMDIQYSSKRIYSRVNCMRYRDLEKIAKSKNTLVTTLIRLMATKFCAKQRKFMG